MALTISERTWSGLLTVWFFSLWIGGFVVIGSNLSTTWDHAIIGIGGWFTLAMLELSKRVEDGGETDPTEFRPEVYAPRRPEE